LTAQRLEQGQSWSYALGLRDGRTAYHLRLTGPGQIRVRAQWSGTAGQLALIINGPGQTGYYARNDGASPLEVAYTVTAADYAKGSDWRVSLVSFSEGRADGSVQFTYPSGSRISPFGTTFAVLRAGAGERPYGNEVGLIVLRGAGPIEAVSIWSGGPASLALIINGPGQTGAHAREDGPSPLSVSYAVKAANLTAGDTWRVSLASFGQADVTGSMRLTYP
jgi:hypothetical protein